MTAAVQFVVSDPVTATPVAWQETQFFSNESLTAYVRNLPATSSYHLVPEL